MAAAGVPKLYRSVIEDVINGVKDVFLDEGVDEQALQELRQIWEKKLLESKAIDPPDHPVPTQVTRPQATATATLQPTTQRNPSCPDPPNAVTYGIPFSLGVPGKSAQPLTIGPNGLVQPTLVQYHPPLRGSPALVDQKLTITLPGQATVMSSPAAAAALALHPDVAASLIQGGVINVSDRPAATTAGPLQFHPVVTLAGGAYTTATAAGQMPTQVVTAAAPQPGVGGVVQLDGVQDTSDEDEDEDEFNEDEEEGNEDGPQEDENEDGPQEEVEPLNSDDDVSDEEATENFEIDNVVVCQYDKISRSRNRWKFHFKDGIMNLQGKDYVFQKAIGDAEW
ncbi:transcription factor IIA L isoform X2 [Amblyomma americanum]